MTGSPPRPATADPPWPDSDQRHDAGDPDEAFPVDFTVYDALVMIFWTFLAQVLVVTVAVAVGLVSAGTDVAAAPITGLTLQIVGQAVTIGGLIAYLSTRGVLSWRLLGPLRPRVLHLAIGAGIGVSGFVIVIAISETVSQVFGPFDAPQQFALQVSSTSPGVLALAIVTAVVLAPILEETVFRSLLFQSIRGKLGLSAAIVLQALVFAFVHFEVLSSPPAIIGLIALALWLAGSFHRTGSLVVPITAHATYNAIVLTVQAVSFLPS